MSLSPLSPPVRSFFARPMARRVLCAAGWGLTGLYFAFVLLILALRYAILPQIDAYRGDVEAALSSALKLPVTIDAIDAGWAGLRPRLVIHGLGIRDAAGRPALGFDNVLAELDWSSLWRFTLRLHRLEIVAPDVDIRRDRDGRYFVAGLDVSAKGGESSFSDWLLAQDRVVVKDAVVRWHDELRAAPPLALQRIEFNLQNDGNRHRFGLVADPPAELAARMIVRGDLRGAHLASFDSWQGEAYAELEYADLAVWRNWIDYPVDLPRGSGGLRLWLSFARLQPTAVTADLSLADVAVRLGRDLPLLELATVAGRLKAARQAEGGYEVQARGLSLATAGGIRIEPTDLLLRHRAATDQRPAAGEFETKGLDLGALAALAAYLPLDEGARARLASYAPRGRLQDVKLAWSGSHHAPSGWRAQGTFADLGIAAQGTRPGFAGFSGSVEGNESGGRLSLAGAHAAVELPAVFAVARIDIEALDAQASWQADGGGIDVHLQHAAFRNKDAAGEASGRYRAGRAGGPRKIDLSAKLSHGAGNAVWRYMPLVVNQDTRDWLRGAIVGGVSDEVTLRLKGDLAKFPYKDGKDGIFQVKGRFRGATLRYAPDWPEIRGLDGELLFEGARMLISGHRGSILGVGIGPVAAEIADLGSAEELLTIDGRAAGATAGFLKFIEASPVGERIEHYTEDMTAAGNGELRLSLDLPLRHIVDTRVDGRYRFVANQLSPDRDLPPLTEVNGELRFTADRLEAQRIRANLLGMPMSVDVATAPDGGVLVKAGGTLAVRTLAQRFGHPVFEHLSGAAPWNAVVRVKKKKAELRLESSLQGIASSLPEPFNKATAEVLPLVVERKAAPAAGRDLTSIALGDVLTATLVSRRDAGRTQVERGVVAVGTAPRLPERGVLLAVDAKHIDLDFWRRMAANGQGEAALPLSQLDLRTDELAAYGRSTAAVRLSATHSAGIWKGELKSRDAVGNLEWDGRGAGRIAGHLKQLTIPDVAPGKASASVDVPDELPAIDLAVDRFALHGKEFGALKLKAENASDGYWNARFDLRNEDATLTGVGRWRPNRAVAETYIDFKLATKSIERLLDRVGYPEAVKRGSGSLEAALAWNGSPMGLDYPSLNGSVKFEIAAGQFNRLEPGVGRLLGVLSLQSLPRRMTLDFRDVFSQGFAFDAIAGQATVAHGVMETQNLQLLGPAAKVLMTGSVDLGAETQNLKVRVQPALGESIATGVLLAYPATGAAAWVFNKLFGNPFDQVFAYEYAVTGSWADPKVVKLAGPPPPPDGTDAKEGAGK